jgi:spore maturation protein SpmA/spore maturation protein SpmB
MALSRFWLSVMLVSLVSLLASLWSGHSYSLDAIINGKKDDQVLVSEKYICQLPKWMQDSLQKTESIVIPGVKSKDTFYTKSNTIVRISTGTLATDGILQTCKNALLDIVLPLIAYLAFFSGLLQLLIASGAAEKLAKFCAPFFVRIFPEVPADHPSIAYMTLNFAANFLGLDSAATPFGLKAMSSLQELNPDKSKASNAQIMFLCLHAAGLTLIPTSIIGYRAAQNASNPADVMIPCILTSLVGTLAALFIVGWRQKISFKSGALIGVLMALIGGIAGLLFYLSRLELLEKSVFTSHLSTSLFLMILVLIIAYAFWKEKKFTEKDTDVFSSFVDGAREGLNTGVKIFPYVLGMLVAISLFRNSGVFEWLASGLNHILSVIGVRQDISNAMPIALLRPFSSGGSRGFLIDAMHTYGADSFTGRLASVFQCSAETTFYVIAVYFGSIQVRDTRYTLGTMLLVDAVCVLAAIGICAIFF